jgi:predicted DNA-binding transcriptional regulator AlpA
MNYEIVEKDEIECMSPCDVMKALSISRAEAYKLFKTKGFPAFRLGEKNLRVTKKDFKEWLDKQKGEKNL